MSDILCPKCHRKRRIPLEDPLCRGCYLKLIQKPKNLIKEVIKDFHEIHRYCDKWDYNIPQISWDKLHKWEKRKDAK